MTKKMDVFREKCRSAGLRITPQRMGIYQALIATKDHPSVEMVHRQVKKQYPNISLDTVNRTLVTLSDIGMAMMMAGSGDARRYDADMEDHQHFQCLKCKKIFDLHVSSLNNIEIPPCLARFTVQNTSVSFEGFCDSCNQNNNI
ncbi:MAG: transcriptional repressor [Planctomycetes bacterium]|nr:transcriptional repressor [Planctomycetota bacterium]